MIKITVVITPHNFQGTIIEALESVASQTYPRDKIEIILIDDGWSDRTVALARSFLERNAMLSNVVVSDRAKGIGATMNVGWRAATGDWIQFLSSEGLLAPNKLAVQASLISEVSENIGVICSSWRRLSFSDRVWRVAGPVIFPVLTGPIVLKLISPHTGRLGPALFRKKAIEVIGGFSEGTKFAVDEHFMLRIAGSGERANLTAGRIICVEAASSSPLFFERESIDADSRYLKVGVARQHLENVLIAQERLRQDQCGILTPENIQEIASLCGESLSDLFQHDRATFQQYEQRLHEIDPSFIPSQTTRSPSKQWANSLALTQQWVSFKAAALASALIRGVWSPKYGLDRVWYMASNLLRAAVDIGARHAAALAPTRPSNRTLATGTVIVSTATLLFAGLLALGPFRNYGSSTGLVGQPQPSQELRAGSPNIIVASTIYVEPSSLWPLPVEIGQPQLIPPHSLLQIHGLPAAVTLSEGRRLSVDIWAVPMVGLSNLELLVAAGASGRWDLTLKLVAADGSALAQARSALSINGSTGSTTIATAAAKLPPDKADQGTQDARRRSEMTAALPEQTAPAVKPEPLHARTESAVTEGPAALPDKKPSVEQTEPQPVREGEAVAPKPSIAMAPAKLTAIPEVAASRVEPSRSATTTELNDDREAAPQPPAEHAQREATVSPIPVSEPSHASATVIPAEPPVVAAKPNQAPESKAPALMPEERQRVEKMIARGERELADGNISGARQFFLRAAEAGIARGALLLASTYDSHEYVRLRIQGVQPNSAEARKWYTRARELGAAQVDEQLLRLGAAN
jgi:glycosyl transferase family 2